jgi:hypothetical protein
MSRPCLSADIVSHDPFNCIGYSSFYRYGKNIYNDAVNKPQALQEIRPGSNYSFSNTDTQADPIAENFFSKTTSERAPPFEKS